MSTAPCSTPACHEQLFQPDEAWRLVGLLVIDLVSSMQGIWIRSRDVTRKFIEIFSNHTGETPCQYADLILGPDLGDADAMSLEVTDIVYRVAQAEHESTGEPLLDVLRSRCPVLISKMRESQRGEARDVMRAEDDETADYHIDRIVGHRERIRCIEELIRKEEEAAGISR